MWHMETCEQQEFLYDYEQRLMKEAKHKKRSHSFSFLFSTGFPVNLFPLSFCWLLSVIFFVLGFTGFLSFPL